MPTTSRQTEFRPDIEGLRAVAIGLVVLAHAGVRFARGGYVGVDVFFVISGFVITRLLVGELDRSGRISAARFYARRIKRLMPQAVTAIVCVAAASALLLPPVRAEHVAHDVVAAGGYAMNIRLSALAVDYFAQGRADGPLDHFWSLAVEEQFYLVWPLLLLLLAWPRRHRRGELGRPLLAGGLAAVAIASLLYAVHATRVEPESAYFDTRARAWELAAGGLLFLVLGRRRLPFPAAVVAAWTGAAAIGVASVRFDAGTAFPALPALVPTLGAAALIAAGTSDSPAVPTRLLTTRPMRYVGRVSYAWYVWHWPLLVFAAALLGALSPGPALLVLAASFVAAVVTHHLMEVPMRNSTLHSRRPRTLLTAAPAGALTALCAAVLLIASLPSTPTLARSQIKGAAQLQKSHAIQRRARAVAPAPRRADQDRGRPVADGCLAGTVWERRCMYGDLASDTTVVLFGDSHALQYFGAIERVARRRHWRLVVMTKSGCPAADTMPWDSWLGKPYPECDAWHRQVLRRMQAERPAMVVAGGLAHYNVVKGGHRLGGAANRAAMEAAYVAMLHKLETMAGRVVFVGDSPRPRLYIPDCVAEAMNDLLRCAFRRRPAVANQKGIVSAARGVEGVRVLDPTREFCSGRLCAAVIGNVLVYRDRGHITETYARTMTPWFAARLPRLAGAGETRTGGALRP